MVPPIEPTALPDEPASFHSKNGMLTSVWGPPLWHFLHTLSFNYPVTPTALDKKHYMDFILQLRYVLPCGKCRENLKKNLNALPLRMSDMKSRDTFSLYIYNLHELVNTMLKKKSGLTYPMVRQRYEIFRANCLIRETKKQATTRSRRPKKEDGCTKSLYHLKSRCVMSIVPDQPGTRKQPSLQIQAKCQFPKCSTKKNTLGEI